MNPRRAIGPVVALLLAVPLNASVAGPLIAQPPVVEPGFYVHPYAVTGGTPTSLAFGPDTRAEGEGQRLYVTDHANGAVLAFDAGAAIAGPAVVFAEGFDGPLGVVASEGGDVYVSDSTNSVEGPFGFRTYGRVWRLRDTDGDGVSDKRHIVLKDLPNGRHNTNGLAFGPDGMLYIANGNSTDDGVDGGPSEVLPWSGSVVKVNPGARKLSLARLGKKGELVATGWRNVYDLAFSPVRKSLLFVPMNGIDDARQGSTGENPLDPDLEDSDDLLFATDVEDRNVDHFGFPSCMYNVARQGGLKPFQNPNGEVIERFGPCRSSVPRPVSSFGLHTSSNGLAFQTTENWGEEFENDLFVAEWGNLFGPPAGHDIIRVQLDDSGRKVKSQSAFLVMDVPIDIAFDADGAMYIADFSGTIFKIDRAL
ncbi:MAG: PQQ-dependent sugar dehydrogenase [Actinomycetota bacterium]